MAAVRQSRDAGPDRHQPDAGTGLHRLTRAASPPGWSSDQRRRSVRRRQLPRPRHVPPGRSTAACAGNSPPYCPVCYTRAQDARDPFSGAQLPHCYAGDFNGDGKDDLLVHNGNSIMLFRSNGAQLDLVFSAVERVPGSWQFQPGDRFFIGDFNGDGKDEVVVYNSTNWVMEYLGLLADDGNNGLKLIARYDDAMPGWQFHLNDQFYVADFDGDGKKDLFVFNGNNWAIPYVGMLRSSGTGFNLVQPLRRNMPGWEMRPGDRHMVGDFDGDGRRTSGSSTARTGRSRTWACCARPAARCRCRSATTTSCPAGRCERAIATMSAISTATARRTSTSSTATNWSMAYLGMWRRRARSVRRRALRRQRTGLADAQERSALARRRQPRRQSAICSSTTIRTGGPNTWARWSPTARALGVVAGGLGRRVEPGLGRPVRGLQLRRRRRKRDLFVHNQDWFGMIRATPALCLQRIYYRWIHNYRYGRNW